MTFSQDDYRKIGIAFLQGKAVSEIADHYQCSRRSVEGIIRAQWRTMLDALTVKDDTGQLVTAAKLRTAAELLIGADSVSLVVREILMQAACRLAPLDAVLTAEPEKPDTVPSHVN